jgi:hypothetical protein
MTKWSATGRRNSIAPMQVAQILALAEVLFAIDATVPSSRSHVRVALQPEKNVIIGGDFNFGENCEALSALLTRLHRVLSSRLVL